MRALVAAGVVGLLVQAEVAGLEVGGQVTRFQPERPLLR
jgi:hypothetical protein